MSAPDDGRPDPPDHAAAAAGEDPQQHRLDEINLLVAAVKSRTEDLPGIESSRDLLEQIWHLSAWTLGADPVISARIPRDLHAALRASAKDANRSVEDQIRHLLRHALTTPAHPW